METLRRLIVTPSATESPLFPTGKNRKSPPAFRGGATLLRTREYLLNRRESLLIGHFRDQRLPVRARDFEPLRVRHFEQSAYRRDGHVIGVRRADDSQQFQRGRLHAVAKRRNRSALRLHGEPLCRAEISRRSLDVPDLSVSYPHCCANLNLGCGWVRGD